MRPLDLTQRLTVLPAPPRRAEMSTSYAAEQYEQDFLPRRLGNWEVPRSAAAVRAFSAQDAVVVRATGQLAGVQAILPRVQYVSRTANIRALSLPLMHRPSALNKVI